MHSTAVYHAVSNEFLHVKFAKIQVYTYTEIPTIKLITIPVYHDKTVNWAIRYQFCSRQTFPKGLYFSEYYNSASEFSVKLQVGGFVILW